ncbi:MAG: ATP-binding protein [Bacteroidia bacterium]|nr:MAG: ATP-binding protein [Bacteroidia bacterium]
MKELSLHILDIVQNAISAEAGGVVVRIEEDTVANTFAISIADNGRGMSREVLERVTDPYYTSRQTRKVGMGIPLLKHSAEQAGGGLTIQSAPGEGTAVEATFVHDHIDRPDLGDIAGVMVLLIGGNPEIRFRYEHEKDGREYVLDTEEVKEVLEDMPISDPAVMKYIREMIRENLADNDII